MPEETVETPEEVKESPEWAQSIGDEGLRTAVSGYESQDKLLDALGVQAPKQVDWREGLPEDLSKVAERFASPQDALRSIEQMRKRESQVRVPGKDASDDDMKAYHKAIGVPEDAKGYEFEIPEHDTEQDQQSREEWGKRFHQLNVPKETASELMRMVKEDFEAVEAQQNRLDQEFAKKAEDELRAEWKGEYDRNLKIGNRAFTALAEKVGISAEDLRKIETKDGRFLMDRPELIKVFAAVGREMEEGTLGPKLTDEERDTVDDQIRDIRKKIQEAQGEGDSKRANRLFEKEMDLIRKRDGDAPIVGSAGRAA